MERGRIPLSTDVTDLRQQVAAADPLDCLHDHFELGPHLCRVRELHQIAATADAEMSAGRLDPVGSGRDDPHQTSLRAPFWKLDFDFIARGRQRHEQHLALVPPEAETSGDKALDRDSGCAQGGVAHGSLVRYLTIWDTD